MYRWDPDREIRANPGRFSPRGIYSTDPGSHINRMGGRAVVGPMARRFVTGDGYTMPQAWDLAGAKTGGGFWGSKPGFFLYRQKYDIGRRARQAHKGLGVGFAFDAVFSAADITAQTMTTSAAWGVATGRSSGYVGGATAGFYKSIFENAPAMVGAAVGAAVGQTLIPIPVAGTIAGAIAGDIAGRSIGRLFGEDFARSRGKWAMRRAQTGISREQINFGGDFRDSQGAYTMRQLAVQEMAGSLLNARQYLAAEARLLHR